MTEQTVEFDLAELIGGSVDSIAAKLSQLSNAELQALHAMEGEAVKPRKGVIDAIDAEVAGRPPEPAQTSGPVADVALAAVDAQAARIATLEAEKNELGEQLGEALALAASYGAVVDTISTGLVERGLIAAGESYVLADKVFATIDGGADKIAELTGLLEAATAPGAAPAAAPKLALPKKPKALEVADYTVVFADSAGQAVSNDVLPPMDFAAADFVQRREMVALRQAVDFPVQGQPEQVCSAWLMKADKAVGRCVLMAPLAIGGGRSARIPAGSLAFRAE